MCVINAWLICANVAQTCWELHPVAAAERSVELGEVRAAVVRNGRFQPPPPPPPKKKKSVRA